MPQARRHVPQAQPTGPLRCVLTWPDGVSIEVFVPKSADGALLDVTVGGP